MKQEERYTESWGRQSLELHGMRHRSVAGSSAVGMHVLEHRFLFDWATSPVSAKCARKMAKPPLAVESKKKILPPPLAERNNLSHCQVDKDQPASIHLRRVSGWFREP